jgi:DNA-directed RNA polymerase specialized sigma24 family protein
MDDLDQHVPSIVAGDPDAFARWLAGAEPRVRQSLLRFAAQVDIEAVLQECLLRVWQVAPRFVADGRPDGLVRLAIRIGNNLALDELRRRRVRPEELAAIAEHDHPAISDPAPSDPRLRETILVCRDALPHKPARVLMLRLSIPMRPDRDLAAMLDMKLNTFLKNFGRARALLAECLRRHGIDLAAELT